MTHRSVPDFLASAAFKRLKSGVFSVVFCEEDWLVPQTVAHALSLRPRHVLVIGRTGALADDQDVSVITMDLSERSAKAEILNRLIPALDGRWLTWVSNGEFLIFPWCETRTLGDLTQFLGDERRRVLYSYALDLYAPEMPAAEALREAELWFDFKGYHAFPEEDRRLTAFGGLGWRFEEFFPPWLQQIGRPAVFRAAKGLQIERDLMFEDTAYRSVSAPWHHSPTGAVMSLRRTRRLLLAPGFDAVADRLIWQGSARFSWQSRQLLDLGMIEPGQWF